MAEKKKRQRPTKAQVEELEEVIHRQCQELDGWREKYRELLKSIKEGKEVKVLRDHIGALESENEALKHSKEMMEGEIKKMFKEIGELQNKCVTIEYNYKLYKNRGFWARLFNK